MSEGTDPAPSGSPGQAANAHQTRLILTVAATVAALYFGSDVLVPIALAILLSFVLAPGVRLLQAWHLGRVAPVAVMTVLAGLAFVGLAALMATQVRDLANRLPAYEDTIAHKAEALRGLTAHGSLKDLSTFVSTLSMRLSNEPARDAVPAQAGQDNTAPPLPVTIRRPEPTSIETLRGLLGPLLHPMATGGIVVIYVIFILLQREDLRNRLIRLLGGDLHRSTAAIDDAARRLSRYLLAQLGLNTAAGIVIGLALWLVGIPSPLLWGVLFGCLRFVPYLGAPLAAVTPIVLAAASDPGWSAVLWTVTLFIVIESVVGQIIEPFFYGHNTGLSPIAVIVAATFWTTLWGPIGLILSTPITVCLVVLGRHVEHLRFLDVLFGDQPPLTPPEVFYQRMLADDPMEASDQAYKLLRQMSLMSYYESVVLPALRLAQEDVAQGRLDVERQGRIAEATGEVIEDLAEEGAEGSPGAVKAATHTVLESLRAASGPTADPDGAPAVPSPGEAWRAEGTVLCLGAKGPLDDAAAIVLAQLLARHGFGTACAPHDILLKARIVQADLSKARIVVLSCLDGGATASLRFVVRRLRRKAPRAKILVGAWWRGQEDAAAAHLEEPVGDAQAGTLSEAVAFCIGLGSAESGDDGHSVALSEASAARPASLGA